MIRDLSQLDADQLVSIYNSNGRAANDFNAHIVAELSERLLGEYPVGFSPWYCGIDIEQARKHASWLPVYEIVKDSPEYQKRVSEVWKTCPKP